MPGNEGRRRPQPWPKGKAAAFIAAIFLSGAALPSQAGPYAQEWWKAPTGPVYQVLVYSFADSDGDGRGDLRGLTERLDYLKGDYFTSNKGLQIQALILSPVHPASSYHGYDILDYKAVSPVLGTMEDFDRLILECHRRGIKLVMDMVFNHSSSAHPWFKAFLADPEGPYGGYYLRKDPALAYGTRGKGSFYAADGKNGPVEYFSSFGAGMPDLDCANPSVLAELKDILAFWIARGADGFRFDAVKHAFDPNEVRADADPVAMNLAFWKDLRAFAKFRKPDILFLGEVMSDYPSELAAYAPCMDSLFDFPQAKRLLAALPSVSDSGLARDRAAELALLTGSPGFVPAVFLSNHDQDRSMGVLLSRSGVMGTRGWGIEADDAFAKAKETALARAKMAATALFTLGGMPVVYYGEELGMTGRRFMGDDVARRDAFIWNDERNGPPTAAWAASSGKIESGQNSNTPSLAAQALDPGSLFSHYSRLSELMRARKALQGGSWSMPEWAGFQAAGIVAYSRTGGGERLLVLHNLSLEAKDLPLPEGMSLSLVFQNSRGAQEPSPTGPAIRSSLRIPPLDSMVFSY